MEWIKTNFKQAVLIALLTVILSTLGSLIVFSFSRKTDKLENAASVNYVDGKCNETRVYIDDQDVILKNYIDTQDGQAAERMNRIQVDMSKKADKDDFDKVYEKCEENNRLSIEILKMLKDASK